MNELNFDSISKFAEAIKTTLHAKAIAAVAKKKEEMVGVPVTEEVDDGEVEFSFDPGDLNDIVKIAQATGIKYTLEDDEFSIEEDDADKVDAFFDALDEKGIKYEIETEEDDVDVDEAVSLKRVHTSAMDKLAHKKTYRKNRSKLKIKNKRYRKTAHAKRLARIGKRKAKQGKTATGRRMVKRI